MISDQSFCKHIAIIMDGNGRWAQKRFLPRTLGHKAGVKALKNSVKAAMELKIEVLTVYAFSTENWCRPDEEVSFLTRLFLDTLKDEFDELNEAKIRLQFIGDLSRFSTEFQRVLEDAVQKTEKNDAFTLVIALNYGAKSEIVAACKNIAEKVKSDELTIDAIDEASFSQHLALNNLPPIELLIRTSGEKRISNFLLWQLAYSEFYFTDCLWPDFGKKELLKALKDYQKRERRFGGVGSIQGE